MKQLERGDLFEAIWRVSHNIDAAVLAETKAIGSLPDGKTSRRLRAVKLALDIARCIYDERLSWAVVDLDKLRLSIQELRDKEP